MGREGGEYVYGWFETLTNSVCVLCFSQVRAFPPFSPRRTVFLGGKVPGKLPKTFTCL